MTNIATRAAFLQNIAKGKGFYFFGAPTTNCLSTNTTSNANSAYHIWQFLGNSIGSTLPGTIQGFLLPPITSSQQLMTCLLAASSNVGTGGGLYLVRIYKLGTVVLSATGDQFTHDAATFPVLKTRFGVTNSAVPLLPFLQLTTAPATTAPAMILKTAAGGNGYTDQDGNGTVGTVTLTLPSATTATGSSYLLPLENGDSGVLDVSAVQVTTAGSAGAATVWGVDIITNFPINGGDVFVNDTLFSGITMRDISPAVATSGTATSHLAAIWTGTNNVDGYVVFGAGALNV